MNTSDCRTDAVLEKSQPRTRALVILALRAAVATTLIARGYLYIEFSGPYTSILWSEESATPWVKRFLGLDWNEYAQTSYPYISFGVAVLGWVLVAAGIAAIFADTTRRRAMDLLVLAAGITSLHAYAFYLDHRILAVLLEMALHAVAPLLLVFALRFGVDSRIWKWTALVASALCFGGHGFLASGYVSTPPEFIFMTGRILGLSEPGARIFLAVAAHLDFIVAALIFVPVRKVRSGALLYMTGWGLATALARVLSHLTPAESAYGLHPWLMETVVRFVAALVPLALWFRIPRCLQWDNG
jgi:hypothetical protein